MTLNYFKSGRGERGLKNPRILVLFFISMFVITWIISFSGFVAASLIVAIPFVLGYIWLIFEKPRIGFIILFVYNFIALGLTRYVPGIPFGIGVDAQLFCCTSLLF